MSADPGCHRCIPKSNLLYLPEVILRTPMMSVLLLTLLLLNCVELMDLNETHSVK